MYYAINKAKDTVDWKKFPEISEVLEYAKKYMDSGCNLKGGSLTIAVDKDTIDVYACMAESEYVLDDLINQTDTLKFLSEDILEREKERVEEYYYSRQLKDNELIETLLVFK